MSDAAQSVATSPARITFLDVLRLLSELIAFGVLAAWGALTWTPPWNIAIAIGAPLLTVLLWALVVSPKAVVAVHPFIRALVELGIFASVTFALWDLGLPWWGIGFAAFAVLVGALHNSRRVTRR